MNMSRAAVADFVDSFFTRILFQADDKLAASALDIELASDAEIVYAATFPCAFLTAILKSLTHQDQRNFLHYFRICHTHHHPIPHRLPSLYR